MQNLLQNQERKFTEILFQGRNKDYGAYVIRTEYGNTMMKAMFAGVALFAAVAISPLVINSIKTPPVIVDRIGDGHVLKPVDEIPEKDLETYQKQSAYWTADMRKQNQEMQYTQCFTQKTIERTVYLNNLN